MSEPEKLKRTPEKLIPRMPHNKNIFEKKYKFVNNCLAKFSIPIILKFVMLIHSEGNYLHFLNYMTGSINYFVSSPIGSDKNLISAFFLTKHEQV